MCATFTDKNEFQFLHVDNRFSQTKSHIALKVAILVFYMQLYSVATLHLQLQYICRHPAVHACYA